MSKKHENTRFRITIDLTEEQKTALDDYIPWGLRAGLMQVVVDDLVNLLKDEKHRKNILACILAKRTTMKEWSSLVEGKSDV